MSEYPKWVDHPTEVNRVCKDGTKVMERVLVQDAKEEAKVTGKEKAWDKKPVDKKD